jgi:outer membrane protein OmpA-like peptidoglycan-associated protein
VDYAPLDKVTQTLRRGGEPLDGGVRAGFAARVGRDPGAVRVHRDAAADASARALDSVAFTVGGHLVFRAGAYRPATPAGRRLIDHELVHVLQQRGGLPGPLRLGGAEDPAELEANRLADPTNPDRARQPVTAEAAGVVRRQGVSYELADAPYSTVDELAAGRPDSERGFYESLTEDERRVMGWLRLYATDIAVEADTRGVDRRAVAGAIAMEALMNVDRTAMGSRAAGGPGKVHTETSHGPDTRVSMPFEVEQLGLVPRQTPKDRTALLQTPGGSITYIAAIMQALAMESEKAGFDHWHEPAVLCWAYNAKYVDTWAEYLAEKKAKGETSFDTSGERLPAWVATHLQFLELAVGRAAEASEQQETALVSEAPPIYTVYFATDSALLDGDATAEVGEAVALLRAVPDGTMVSIVGHADESGDPDHNVGLSERRAMAVFRAIEEALKPNAERLTFSVIGRGETEPAADLRTSRRVRVEIGH